MTQKKRHIIVRISIIAILIAFAGMVTMSILYVHQTSVVLSARFDDEVNRCLNATSSIIEEQDMINFISQIAQDTTDNSKYAETLLGSMDADDPATTLYGRTIGKPTGIYGLYTSQLRKAERQLNMNRALMMEVMARKNASAYIPITDRIDTAFLRQTITSELQASGIDNDFSLALICFGTIRDINYISGCEFDPDHEEIYKQMVFRREVTNNPYYIVLHFHDKSSYIDRYTRLVLPIIICMSILALLVALTILYLIQNQRLSEIQNAFIKNMTHELKTPVASISLASEMLADPSIRLSPESTANKAKTIHSEAHRLTLIIDRVLQTSLLEHSSDSYKTEPIDIHAIISDSRDAFSLKVQQKTHGKILLNLDATQHIIYADRMHMTNVIFNLMENAVKYSDPERPLILEISTRNSNGRLFIEVSDNGIGIDQKYLSRIFDRFYRVPAVGDRHDVKGFGLGLSYVREVVRKNGGNISVLSKLAVGTRFTLDFPAFDK